MSGELNLTKTRLATLRLIQQKPMVDQAHLAQVLYDSNHIKWKGYYKDDAPKYMYGPSGQSSARWSGNYIGPLIDAGLVKRHNDLNGGFLRHKLTLTEKGRKIFDEQ